MITQEQIIKYVYTLSTDSDLPTEPLALLFANLDATTIAVILKDATLDAAINDAIDAEEVEEEAAIRGLADKLKAGNPLKAAIDGVSDD